MLAGQAWAKLCNFYLDFTFPIMPFSFSNSYVRDGFICSTTNFTSSRLSLTKTLLCSNEESKAREATLLNCLTSGEEEEVASDQYPGQECDMAKLKILLGRTQVDWCNHAEREVF